MFRRLNEPVGFCRLHNFLNFLFLSSSKKIIRFTLLFSADIKLSVAIITWEYSC